MAGASPVQTQEDLVPPAPAAIGYRWAGVLLAPPVAVTVAVILTGPFGIDLQVPEAPGSAALRDLDLLTVTLFTLGIGLAGWLAVALLERGLGGPRGRRVWILVAFGVFVVSLFPVAALDVAVGSKWGLFALHAAVALVLIPALANGTAAAHPVAGGWVEANAPAAAAHDESAHGHDDHHDAHDDAAHDGDHAAH